MSIGGHNFSVLKKRLLICSSDPDHEWNRKFLLFSNYPKLRVCLFIYFSVLPSTPRNVRATFVNQSALGLQWQRPQVTGDQTKIWYDVYCRKPCDSNDDSNCVDKTCGNDVVYEPSQVKLNTAQVIVGNLSSFVNYTIKIYARNRVSEVAERKHGVEGEFETIIVRTNGSGE